MFNNAGYGAAIAITNHNVNSCDCSSTTIHDVASIPRSACADSTSEHNVHWRKGGARCKMHGDGLGYKNARHFYKLDAYRTTRYLPGDEKPPSHVQYPTPDDRDIVLCSSASSLNSVSLTWRRYCTMFSDASLTLVICVQTQSSHIFVTLPSASRDGADSHPAILHPLLWHEVAEPAHPVHDSVTYETSGFFFSLRRFGLHLGGGGQTLRPKRGRKDWERGGWSAASVGHWREPGVQFG